MAQSGLKAAQPGTTEEFHRDGFTVAPFRLEADLVQRVSHAMDQVMAEEYETGIPPIASNWHPGDDEAILRKIDGAQVSDSAIYEMLIQTGIGAWAAELYGAQMVQLWTCQMLYKPSGPTSTTGVGWHQDDQYWASMIEGESFTVWVAISDVTADSGPLIYVKGSNKWGPTHGGNFFSGDLDGVRAGLGVDGKDWNEYAAILPPGGMSIHHRLTMHGSRQNTSGRPRRGFALHLRTEKSSPLPRDEDPFFVHLDNPQVCPVMFPKQ